MGAFGSNFSNFRAIWLGTTKSKLQNGCGAVDQNIQTFISTLGYLWLTRASWINSAPSEPSNSSQSGHIGANVAIFDQFSNFRRLWGGIVSLLFASRTKTRVLWTRVDLCYYCGPFPACVGEVFKHVCVQTLFLRTFEDIYGYLSNSHLLETYEEGNI